ncbi:hypothetical protein [Marinomonas sp. PE14-40]|uniref:hypothetical protein n=1 Tax=Marinomonas sp. PE14-40 TaxID=3060621 RepID=UPI003F681C77
MKLLVWTLIEIITLLVFSGGLLIWFKRRLNKNKSEAEAVSQEASQADSNADLTQSESTPESEDPNLAALKRFVNNQILHASKQLSRAKNQDKSKKVILIKLWGTLLKAEAKVLETSNQEDTESILNKQLSNILNNIFSANKENLEVKALKTKLAKLVKSAIQSNEVLQLKVELDKAQGAIRKELLIQIDKLEEALNRLSVKKHEQNNLELSITSAMKNVDQLKQALKNLELDNEFEEIMQQDNLTDNKDSQHDLGKHRANKKINSLNQIASRQQIVIDLLREKLNEASKEESINIDESQEIAIGRIEQMIKESDTLILQLENELGTTNVSIESLKSDIQKKSEQLIATEKKLVVAKKTASTSFRESAKNQQSKVEDMKIQLSNAPENSKLGSLIEEQQKESATLEKLLKESETCVTVLELELESARKANNEIIHTIETVDPNFRNEASSGSNNKFQQLENHHHKLLTEHSQVKQQLLASISQDQETELRNEYNRKNLEADRLQLAIIDLEKKQLDSSKHLNQ